MPDRGKIGIATEAERSPAGVTGDAGAAGADYATVKSEKGAEP
jgi:hypothetical protein